MQEINEYCSKIKGSMFEWLSGFVQVINVPGSLPSPQIPFLTKSRQRQTMQQANWLF